MPVHSAVTPPGYSAEFSDENHTIDDPFTPILSPMTRTLIFAIIYTTLLGMSVLQPTLLYAQDDPDPTRFSEEIDAFEQWDRKNSAPEDAVLFVGSSSIRMWPTATSFPEHNVINRGFGGSHLSDVNHYIDRVVLKYAPRAVVLYAGDNDIAAEKSPETVLADYRTFVETVQERFPETDIFYVPIKPSLSRWSIWPQMQKANTLVRAYIDEDPQLHYVDIATPMLSDNGEPDPALFLEDGLHLSPEGYRLWDRILRPHLDAMTTGD